MAKTKTTQTQLSGLASLTQKLQGCTRCTLCEARTHVVIGDGNPQARLVFVGEAPGREEDLQGIPFVGDAGQLLNKMIAAMGLTRESIYVCNLVKCRPAEDRNLASSETQACLPFLIEQLSAIRPEVVVTLGKAASHALLKSDLTISDLRGKFKEIPELPGVKLMPTFHPAYLLRTPSAKKEVWEDLKLVAKALDLPLTRG